MRLSGQLTALRRARWSFPFRVGRAVGTSTQCRPPGGVSPQVDRALGSEPGAARGGAQAWKRIIRVLSHEINNSLAPIKSISGSLHSLLTRSRLPAETRDDVERGLGVISSRAETLGRFMASYAKLARLPAPRLAPVSVGSLVRMVADLETRVPVEVVRGPAATCPADADQLQQALINLVRNAVDATLKAEGERVRLGWEVNARRVEVLVEDEGPGLSDTGNLFVPSLLRSPGARGSASYCHGRLPRATAALCCWRTGKIAGARGHGSRSPWMKAVEVCPGTHPATVRSRTPRIPQPGACASPDAGP